ncbi:MAG: FAD-linked oxidase C-terminal domain-containing protein [Thermodesulfobacteriota bacterium]
MSLPKELLTQLAACVDPDQLITAKEELLCYGYDGSGGNFPPEAVIFPASSEEVSAIMRVASRFKLPVVPRGAGSGMTGGALAVAGGLVLSLARMNRIVEIDTENQVALVEPGVINQELRDALAPHGLFYPPDPASLKFCTMGGNVAECAGGPSAVKYGVTRDYILGLEVVLADGRIIKTGVRTAKGVAGYDLTRLLIGSEGTLAIITQITLRLVPKPTHRRTVLLASPSLTAATGLVARLLRCLTPATLEYLDATALAIVADQLPFPLPEGTRAMLLIELDGSASEVASSAQALTDFLTGEELLLVRQSETPQEREQLWQARRTVSPAAFKLKPDKMGEDVVVPRSRIPQLVETTEKLARKSSLPIFTFGHAGDGNIHVNIMLDRSQPDEVEQARQAKKQLFKRVIDLGGTISGEHGIGTTKKEYLDLELDATSLELQRQLKGLFDPLNILNPHKILPD